MTNVNTSKGEDSRALSFLYNTVPGRVLLKLAAARTPSRIAGRFIDSPLSRPLVGRFARRYAIDLADYEGAPYACFNDFFCRRIRPGLRPLPEDPRTLFAPCDGRLTAYPIEEGTVLPIKQSRYTISSLLGGDPIAARYRNGLCLVFRLCVDNYHRYCYVDSGVKGPNIFLPGRLHTVRPIALAAVPVFAENCREYTVMQTERFGAVTQVEVGAMLVGRIANRHGPGPIARGDEKGRFLYGGSTVALLLEPGRVRLCEAILARSARGEETPVRLGEPIGTPIE